MESAESEPSQGSGHEKSGTGDIAMEIAEEVLTSFDGPPSQHQDPFQNKPVASQEPLVGVRSAQDVSGLLGKEEYRVRAAPSVPNLAAMTYDQGGAGSPLQSPAHLQPMPAASMGARSLQFPGGLGRATYMQSGHPTFGRAHPGAGYAGGGMDLMQMPVNMGRAALSQQVSLDVGPHNLSARTMGQAPRQVRPAIQAAGGRHQPAQAFEAVSGFPPSNSFSVAPPRATGRSPSLSAVDFMAAPPPSGYLQQQQQQHQLLLQQAQQFPKGSVASSLHAQSQAGSQFPQQHPGSAGSAASYGIGAQEHARLTRHPRSRPPDN